MCWMGLVDGQAIGTIWLEGNMNKHVHKEMMETQVNPAIRNKKVKWIMQDEATCHTYNLKMEFLKTHFKELIISCVQI